MQMPSRGAPAAALALVGRRLRDRLDRQPLHLGPVAVPGDARGARVDDVLDAGHGERGLGHVGRQHHPAGVTGRGRRSKTRCCSAADSRAYKRQHLEPVPARSASRSAVSRISRSPLRNTRMSPGPSAESSSTASLMACPRSGPPRLPRRAAGTGPPRGRSGRIPRSIGAPEKAAREPLRVDGRGGDDHLQVRALGQQLPEVAEDEVDVQAALVRLVDDQRVVAAQLPVAGELVQQDAIGHQLDQRVVGGHVGEPDLVADRLAQRAAQFLGYPLGDRPGRQPPRLGVADLPVDAAAQLEADLGDLGRLARAGLPRDDHYLVVADGRQDLVLALADGQLSWIRDRRHGRPAGGARGGACGGAAGQRPGAPGTPGPRPGIPGGRRHHRTRLHTGGKNRSDRPGPHRITDFRPVAFRQGLPAARDYRPPGTTGRQGLPAARDYRPPGTTGPGRG